MKKKKREGKAWKGGKGRTAVILPELYADPKTTDLSYEVQPGKQTFDIELR